MTDTDPLPPLDPEHASLIAETITNASLDSFHRIDLAEALNVALPDTPWYDLIHLDTHEPLTLREWSRQAWQPTEGWGGTIDMFKEQRDNIRSLLAEADAQIAAALSPYGHAVLAWLDGAVEELPTHLGPPTEETHELLETLRALNLAGLITHNSQPGRPDQRANLDAVTTPSRALLLVELAREAGLWADAWPLGAPPPALPAVVVTGDPWLTIALCRHAKPSDPSPADLALLEPDTRAPALIRENIDMLIPTPIARSCWSVTLIDPEWDRRDTLWDIAVDATHHPDWAYSTRSHDPKDPA